MSVEDRVRAPSIALVRKERHPMDVSFFLIEPRRGSKVRASSLRYGRRKANVHWTLCDVYRSFQEWY